MLMSHATRIEAIYDAVDADPGNQMIKETIAAGMKHITILDRRTPPDVFRYLKDPSRLRRQRC
eukprot:6503821-Alexandrium_andersonii.AAC.1